jgi:hypothetical protein
MHCIIVLIFCTLGGLVVGAVFHAVFAAKETTSKAELAALSTRLKAAFDSDTQRAKTEVAAVIADIEKKL